ncbi:MAG: hypothetical protein DLM60_14215 [Pseudonocardiales bacterium]|nr:MAG: hypothetical protein DLM60_14215 [Pseudonocardiales bacterium]
MRGPAVKERFVVTDRATGKAWWQYGAATETAEAAAAKHMSDDQLRARIAALRATGIFATASQPTASHKRSRPPTTLA